MFCFFQWCRDWWLKEKKEKKTNKTKRFPFRSFVFSPVPEREQIALSVLGNTVTTM